MREDSAQNIQSSSENEVSENEHEDHSSDEEEEEELPEGVDGIYVSLTHSFYKENTPLPAFWKQFTTSDGKKYYYNAKTRETIWYHPLIYLKKKELSGEILGTSPTTSESILFDYLYLTKAQPSQLKSPKFPKKPEAPKQRPVWIPDNQVTHCVLCAMKFDLLTRKHHCRACGLIFCAKVKLISSFDSQCCSKKVMLPELNYNKPESVCDSCFAAFYSSQP